MEKIVIISKQKDCDQGLIALRNNSIPACFSPRQHFYSYYGNRQPLLEVFFFGGRHEQKRRGTTWKR
ncbi:MAG: hypothetical protein LWX01_09320 [Deltaproteobacteria bacterium]|nr:hypothetical protein [Deltaproteobacteria bacterium]MDL1961876.1 hypothetical protein [Deltaproteobacteria bacterium]